MFVGRARLIAVLVALGGIAALIVGFSGDASSFAGNLLAELVGVLVSVAVAVSLLDWLVRRQREREFIWVHRYTDQAIAALIEEIALRFHVFAIPDEAVGEEITEALGSLGKPHYGRLEAFRHLAMLVEVRRHELGADGPSQPDFDPVFASSRALYEEVRPLFDRLWYQLMPRLMHSVGRQRSISRSG